MAPRPAVDHAVFAKSGTARCDIRVAARIIRGIEHRLEHIEPAFDRLIAAHRRHQKVTRPSCRNIGPPDAFCPITPQLLVGSFQQLDRSRAAKRLRPHATMRVNMTARRVTSRVASRVSEDHHWKFQALGLVYGHDPHTLGALFDDRSLVGLAAFGVSLELLDEGPERGSAPLEMPCHVDEPLTICERLLATRPKRDTGMRAQSLK